MFEIADTTLAGPRPRKHATQNGKKDKMTWFAFWICLSTHKKWDTRIPTQMGYPTQYVFVSSTRRCGALAQDAEIDRLFARPYVSPRQRRAALLQQARSLAATGFLEKPSGSMDTLGQKYMMSNPSICEVPTKLMPIMKVVYLGIPGFWFVKQL